MKKVTKKELQTLQGFVQKINQAQLAIGTLELQKQGAIAEAQNNIGALRAEKELLEKKYNGQQIDITTGELVNATN